MCKLKATFILSICMFLSSAANADWTKLLEPAWFFDMAVSPTNGNSNLFASSFGGIYRSNNAGEKWTNIDSGVINDLTYSLLTVPKNSDAYLLFAGTLHDGILRTSNNGQSWDTVLVGTSYPYLTYFIDSLHRTVIVAKDGDMRPYRYHISTDFGENWSSSNDTEIPGDLNWSHRKYLSDTSAGIINVTDTGVYNTSVSPWICLKLQIDFYLSWNNSTNPISTFIPVDDHRIISMVLVDGYCCVSIGKSGEANNSSFWRFPLSELRTITKVQANEFKYSTTNPNVYFVNVNKSTISTRFNIPTSTHATIQLLNLSGTAVVNLINNDFSPGMHSLQCQATNITSGCYILRMKMGFNTIAKNILISR